MSTALSLFLYSGIFFFQFASFYSYSFILLFTLLRHFKVLPFCLVQPLQMLLLPLLFAAKLFVCTITGLFRFRSQFPSFFCRRFDHLHHHHRPIGVCLCLPPLHHYLLGTVQCTLSCSCFFCCSFFRHQIDAVRSFARSRWLSFTIATTAIDAVAAAADFRWLSPATELSVRWHW